MAEAGLSAALARLHEEAFAVERVHFKKTKKRTSPERTDPFLALAGAGPALVAAPHSVRRVRGGRVLPSAEFTGALAFLLHREVGCHALAVKKLYGGDPEWDRPCLFKARLGELVRSGGVETVLVLRGSPPQGEAAVGLVPGPGRPSRELAATLQEALTGAGLASVTAREPAPPGGHPVAAHCAAALGLAAVRVELGHRYRAPNRNGADFRRAFRGLAAALGQLA